MPKKKRILIDPNDCTGTIIDHTLNGHKGAYNFCKMCKVALNNNTLRGAK